MAGDLKTEPQQRVRIGLTGLAVVFLLVLLGTAISRSGAGDAPLPGNAMVNAAPDEPLAEIGAAPSQGASGNEGNSAATVR